MRILMLDHYYEGFVQSVFLRHPQLARHDYDTKVARFARALFGETQFQIDALQALGHEALFLPVNVPSLVESWASRRGVRLPKRGLRLLSRKHGIPWISRRDRTEWVGDVLGAVVDEYAPDVIQVQCVSVLPPSVVRRFRASQRLVVGQTASPLPPWFAADAFDLLISALPSLVQRFRELGVRSEYLPLAFGSSLSPIKRPTARDVNLSFVGSLSEGHEGRIDLLGDLAAHTPVDFWSPQWPDGWAATSTMARRHEAVWGADTYRILGRSRMTLNVHGDIAQGYAACLRMFEATGMGALLVTDAARNLDDLFVAGEEVVTFVDKSDLWRVVDYYMKNRGEASRIARAGYKRTQRDHTWDVRMGQWLRMVDAARRGHRRDGLSASQ